MFDKRGEVVILDYERHAAPAGIIGFLVSPKGSF